MAACYNATMLRDDLAHTLDTWLEPDRFRDVGENGLQVEGRETIEKVVCGVSANLDLIDAAIDAGADALFVHHGLVWGGGIRRLSGWLGERVRRLIKAELSLFAYHLPLDAHPELGNNAGLADALGVSADRRAWGDYKGQLIGFAGPLEQPRSLGDIVTTVRENVGEPLCVFGDLDREVRSVGLCTGGAPDLLHEAIGEVLDLYITGEATEWCKAIAEESGTAFIAGGHHATERFGARRVAGALTEKLGLDATFIDVENPA